MSESINYTVQIIGNAFIKRDKLKNEIDMLHMKLSAVDQIQKDTIKLEIDCKQQESIRIKKFIQKISDNLCQK